MTEFIDDIRTIVDNHSIITDSNKSLYYRTGFRSGGGSALAVIFPSTLLQQWLVIKACIKHQKIIIMQAANTGLTEGSTPHGDNYDRDVVIINTTRIHKIYPIKQGRQVIALAGATLHTLEKTLKPFRRTPHSVIGSSCIGASVIGGVANNSGGALVKRGPAYTELSLFARCNQDGELELVNHLGVDLGNSAEEILTRLDNGDLAPEDIKDSASQASDHEYIDRVRDIYAESPARYNANTERLYEASGCAGKLAVFAVRLDTFAAPQQERVFYIGTNNPSVLTTMRRDILTNFKHLPETAEYLHRDCFRVAEHYGKDTFLLIQFLGTDLMPKLFALKGALDARLNKIKWLPNYLCDRLLQRLSRCFPQHLPKRMLDFSERFEHHLILKVSDEAIDEALTYLQQTFPKGVEGNESAYFCCSTPEANKAYLHRFAAAGAAIRYQLIHSGRVGEVMALDIALKRNETDWQEKLPTAITDQLDLSLYYGHFLCHVFHQDYVVKQGVDANEIKRAILDTLEQRGAKYPAEHNVGHLYKAEQGLADFYKKLDPTDVFNPKIGG